MPRLGCAWHLECYACQLSKLLLLLRSSRTTPAPLASFPALVVDFIAELLGADAVMRRLVAHAEGAAARHGGRGAPAALAALDVCLLLAEGMGSMLESCCAERAAQDPPPEWLQGARRRADTATLHASTWVASAVSFAPSLWQQANASLPPPLVAPLLP